MNKKRVYAIFVLVMLSILMVPTASMKTSAYRDYRDVPGDQDLADRASYVVIGQVTSVTSSWNNDRTLIYSYVGVSVERYLKGAPQGTEIVIRVLGGEVGDIGLGVSSEPRFARGEKVKAFLKLENDYFTVVGGSRGKISLESVTEASGGFSYSGFHWETGDIPVKYYISTTVPSSWTPAIQQSFQTWEDVPGSYMDYTYMGTTTIGPPAIRDNVNVVSYGNIDGTDGKLARCTYWYWTATLLLIETDIEFDSSEPWSTTGAANAYDVQNVGTHEVGHTLNLHDLKYAAYSEMTMYGYAEKNETKKRTLEAGDIAGISFIYGPGPKFERFGPRADRLLIQLYNDKTVEFNALEVGEIDITDWPLNTEFYERFSSPPLSNETNVVSYGAAFMFTILEINNNPNQFLGNPQDPAYPNPVYPNPLSVLSLRKAIAYLIDRWDLTYKEVDFKYPIYTPVPPAMGRFAHPDIVPDGLLENLTYPKNITRAQELLDADFPVNPDSLWRFWDRNGNGVEDPNEYLELKLLTRIDDLQLIDAGLIIAGQLRTVGQIRVNQLFLDINSARMQVKQNKDFHLYIGNWITDVYPDHLISWHSSSYWHPGLAENYAGANNTAYDEASYNFLYANNWTGSPYWAWEAQKIFAENVLSVPLYAYGGPKAMSRRYTGGNFHSPVTPDDGENMYRGQPWNGTVNVKGYGIDNFWSFLNMHPQGFERGDGENMTIRYGFKTPRINSLNPIYSNLYSDLSYWDNKVLDMIYENLLARNASDLEQLMPWLAENYSVATYYDPIYKRTLSKASFTLRPLVLWSDGTPITTADVHFTLVELDDILAERNLPPPSWIKNVKDIIDFKILDAYNFEVLLDVETMWAPALLGLNRILPKHIWKPIVETGDPTSFAPDPNMIGSGPYRFVDYLADSHVLMYANRPGRTVQTNLPGSGPITSPYGYWRYSPLIGVMTVDGGHLAKVDYYTQPHTISFTVINEYYGGPITIDLYVTTTFADGTIYEETITGIGLNAKGTPGDSYSYTKSDVMKGKVKINGTIHVKSPPELAGWSNCTRFIWSTIKEDIAGSTLYDDLEFPDYTYKRQLPTPDIKVDIRDIAVAARAFGSYPGYIRWNPIADINGDYKIDIRDIAAIAKKFGWPP